MAGAERFEEKEQENEDEADYTEMESLVTACRRLRVASELQPWLAVRQPRISEEDVTEMKAMLGSCRSARLRRELAPWLTAAEGQAAEGLASPTKDRAAQGLPSASDLPVAVIVGVQGTGKRRLLAALAGVAASATSQRVLEATVETKYYSARVQFRCIELGAGALGSNDVALLRDADAVIFLWDLAQPGSLEQVRRTADEVLGLRGFDASLDEAADIDELEQRDRVQLCVAVEGCSSASQGGFANLSDGAALDAAEDEARAWCAGSGFEHLRCALTDSDLEALRGRCRAAKAGAFGGLLDVDTDGTPLRILEALESYTWPGLERRKTAVPAGEAVAGRKTEAAEAAAGRQAAHRGDASQTAADAPPLVVVAGAAGVGKRDLVRALTRQKENSSIGEESAMVEAVLQTKYYSARLRFCVVDVEEGPGVLCGQAAELVGSASGLLLLWDPSRSETLACARRVGEACGSRPGAGVRLCVAIEARQSGGEGGRRHELDREALEWCAEQGFEHLRCSLCVYDLEALQRRWCSGTGGGTPLLSEEDGDSGAVRIVEALECHAWPGLMPKAAPVFAPPRSAAGSSAPGAEATAPVPVDPPCVARAEAAGLGGVGGPEGAVDIMERFAEEIKSVRAISDDDKRRDRACDMAMQLAAALGVDDSDSD